MKKILCDGILHASSFKSSKEQIVLNVYSSICVAGKWRCSRPERVQQGPCLRTRDQEQEQQQEEEEEAEVACQSRPTAGTVRVTNMSDISEHTSSRGFICSETRLKGGPGGNHEISV